MAYYSDSHGYMGRPSDFNCNMFQREPTHFNSYANGFSHVVPRCHICGILGHVPAECQQRNYSTLNCSGMNFAQQQDSYHNNYSVGWPENHNVTYRDNIPPISPFPPSYQMQGFRCGEESHHYPQQHEVSTYAPEFNQEHPQFSVQSVKSFWKEEKEALNKMSLQLTQLKDQMNLQLLQMKSTFPQTEAHVPGHQPQEFVPMELNDPPEVQSPKERFNDTEKLSLLCLEYTYSSEDDSLRPVIIKEMKKIKYGRELVEELKEIEINMKLSNTISSLLELESNAPEVHLDTSEVLTPSPVLEQTSKSTTGAAAVIEEEANEIEKEENAQILEEQDPQLVCISEEQAATEDKELEIPEYMHVVIQEAAETGLSNPLDDMLSSDFSTIVSQYIIPLVNVKLKHDLLNSDNAYYSIDFAYDRIHVPHNPHAKITLENACFDRVHVSQDYYCFPEYDVLLAAPCHSTHVLYSYTYMIGYSIDDIVGVSPITSANCSLCEYTFRFLLLHHPLRPPLARVDIPWDPGGYKAW